jgi:hypothetical protein
MKIFRISTTAYKEEDFYLQTELDEVDIVEVITPIVNAERDGYEVYDNELLLDMLVKRYPRKKIELYEEFKNNLPSAIRDIDSRRLMNDIRVGSGLEPIKEEIKLVKDELREQYFRGEIFNVGEQVEADGQQYEIVKRGSNHLLLKESTGKLISKWIQNVTLVEKKVEKKKLKSFKSTVRNLDQNAGLTPQDFTSKTFDPMSNTGVTNG